MKQAQEIYQQLIAYIEALQEIKNSDTGIAKLKAQASDNQWSLFQGVALDLSSTAGDVVNAKTYGGAPGQEDHLSETNKALNERKQIHKAKAVLNELQQEQKKKLDTTWQAFVLDLDFSEYDTNVIKRLLFLLDCKRLVEVKEAFQEKMRSIPNSDEPAHIGQYHSIIPEPTIVVELQDIYKVLIPKSQACLLEHYSSLSKTKNQQDAYVKGLCALALFLLVASTVAAVVLVPPIGAMLAAGTMIMSEGMLALHLLGALAACGGYLMAGVSIFAASNAADKASQFQEEIFETEEEHSKYGNLLIDSMSHI
jgi:Rad3-related DNA helicase